MLQCDINDCGTSPLLQEVDQQGELLRVVLRSGDPKGETSEILQLYIRQLSNHLTWHGRREP